MTHEWKPPLLVHTPHGEGDALLTMDYGLNTNSVWVVRLHGGEVTLQSQLNKGSTFTLLLPLQAEAA
jgi:hypothetical protein